MNRRLFTLATVTVFLIFWLSPFLAANDYQNDVSIADDEDIGLFGLSLEEAAELELVSSATLTDTTRRLTPAAVTTITRQQIDGSGARSLDELLEIYVPGFQVMSKETGDQMGFRGIISDRNNKFLLLVNGVIKNNLTSTGAISERFISMLGDIERIEVVRGAGSATYGPGAVAGVINIITFNSSTFEGTDVQVRQGIVEEFSTFEIRHGRKFADDRGLFLYYGIDNYRGADQDDSPAFFSHDFTAGNGQDVGANQSLPFDIVDNHRSYRNRVRHKLYGQYTIGGFDAYLRYTRGGSESLQPPGTYVTRDPASLLDNGFGYQQFSAGASYDQPINEDFKFNYRFNYDMFDYEKLTSSLNSYREDKYHFRAMGYWDPSADHHLAGGFEYAHQLFGLRSPGYPNESPLINARLEGASPWYTDTYAILGEYQWHFSEPWTAFLGARLDDHTYTDWLFSPRAALVYVPDERDTYKFMYNRSVRRSDEADMREKFLSSGGTSGNDKIDTWEFRLERQQNEKLWLAFSGYYSNYEVVSFSGSARNIQPIGNLKYYGLELEGTYKSDKARLTFSHNYTQQINFELEDDTTSVQNISAEPYGFGDDLANWSDHTTKVTAEYDFLPKWTASTSVRCLWGYPGGEDMAKYNKEVLGDDPRLPISDGSDKAFDPRAYLNVGLEFRQSESTTWRLDAFNILGWIDKDVNKRNVFWRSGLYRNEAAAFGITLRHKF